MADLPRWIHNSKVDSMAMLSAYIQWVGRELRRCNPEAYPEGTRVIVGEEHHTLPTVMHWWDGMPSLKVNEKICTDSLCERCRVGRGGYQFRWYSANWYKDYLKMKREDSWKRGDPEDG
eukprot:Skav219837  [mRNA]  locus=scaffold859:193541:193897:+ [translate_table: standard]